MAGVFRSTFLKALSKGYVTKATTSPSLMIQSKNLLSSTPSRTYCGFPSRNGQSISQVMQHHAKFRPCFSNIRQASAVASSGLFQGINKAPATLSHPSQCVPLQNLRNCHYSSTKSPKDQDTEKPSFSEQMSLRLINVNGFLSWTRNSYLCSAVGATMLNASHDELIQHAGILVLLVSGMNMAWGSACHLSNLIRIRDHISMSRFVLVLNLLMTTIHALLWLFILGYFIQFSAFTCQKADNDDHHQHPEINPVEQEKLD